MQIKVGGKKCPSMGFPGLALVALHQARMVPLRIESDGVSIFIRYPGRFLHCHDHAVMMRFVMLTFVADRNAEKRKEKSRDAARSRRGKEADVFAELSDMLPISAETVASMDKASVMRIAISHMKLLTLLSKYPSVPSASVPRACVRASPLLVALVRKDRC